MTVLRGLAASVLMIIGACDASATEWRATEPAIPELTLQDQDGNRWQIEKLLGSRPVLIGFIFTGCTTICPDTMLTMHGVQQKLSQNRLPAGERPLLLTISLDPFSDTPASLKKFASDQGVKTGADADWLMLTANGLDEDIRPLLEAFGQPVGSPDAHDNLLWIGQPARHRWAFATGYDFLPKLSSKLFWTSGMADALRVLRLFVFCLLLPGVAVAAAAADGRGLFLGYSPFERGQRATRSHRPPQMSSCANCHGDRGEGKREGGVDVPSITATALSSSRQGRPGYRSQAAIEAAIAAGVGRGRKPLNETMPRFSLDGEEMSALLSYLQVVGTRRDSPPGVTSTDVVMGTLLPLSGSSSAVGRQILGGLQDAIDPMNSQGGVNGRHVTLIAEDTARSGDLDAAIRLVNRPVYAVAGGVWTAEDDVSATLAKARVSSIASLVSRTSVSQAGNWSADLLPPATLQREVLDRALAQCGGTGTPRFALSLNGFTGVPSGSDVRYFDRPAALKSLISSSARQGCIGVGLNRGDEIEGIVQPGWRVIVVSPFAGPIIVPGVSESTWHRLGFAAGRVMLEALASAGDVLSERSLLDATAGMAGFSAVEGAPVSYSRSRRYGWDPTIINISEPQTETR